MNKSTPDMWELASALYIHGPNVDTLQGVLPDWTKTDIEYVLRKFKHKADRERTFIQKGRQAAAAVHPSAKKFKNERDVKDMKPGRGPAAGAADEGTSRASRDASSGNSPSSGPSGMAVKDSTQAALLSWSELLHKVHVVQDASDQTVFGVRVSKTTPIKDHSQLLSKVMLYSACFEDHYHGGHPDETAYSEIYRYLSQLLSGEEPTQLRPRSAAKVLQILEKLTAVLSSGGLNDRLAHLVNLDLSTIAKTSGDDSTKTAAASAAGTCVREQEKPSVLFEDPEDPMTRDRGGRMNIGEECDALDPLDPYFPEKRGALNKNLEELQRTTAATLNDLHGLNPLRLPTSLLTKPLAAFPSTYPARASSRPVVTTPKKFSLRHRPVVDPLSDDDEECS